MSVLIPLDALFRRRKFKHGPEELLNYGRRLFIKESVFGVCGCLNLGITDLVALQAIDIKFT